MTRTREHRRIGMAEKIKQSTAGNLTEVISDLMDFHDRINILQSPKGKNNPPLAEGYFRDLLKVLDKYIGRLDQAVSRDMNTAILQLEETYPHLSAVRIEYDIGKLDDGLQILCRLHEALGRKEPRYRVFRIHLGEFLGQVMGSEEPGFLDLAKAFGSYGYMNIISRKNPGNELMASTVSYLNKRYFKPREDEKTRRGR